MKSKILMSSLGAVAALAAGVALAAGSEVATRNSSEVATRNVADAQANLMGTYSRGSGQPADQINLGGNKGQVVGVGSTKPLLRTRNIGTEQLGRR